MLGLLGRPWSSRGAARTAPVLVVPAFYRSVVPCVVSRTCAVTVTQAGVCGTAAHDARRAVTR